MGFLKSPSYLQQELFWSKIWLQANESGHNLKYFSVPCGDGFLTGIIYEYPFLGGKKFWYLARGLVFRSQNLDNASDFKTSSSLKKIEIPPVGLLRKSFKDFLKKLEEEARSEKIIYIQADFDDRFFDLLMFKEEGEEGLEFIRQNLNSKVSPSFKNLQYSQTSLLDVSDLKLSENFDFAEIIESKKIASQISTSELKSWFLSEKDFWNGRNENVRRYSKKSLSREGFLSFEKTEWVFQEFFDMINETAKRQGFNLHPKKYLKEVFDSPNSRVIRFINQENKTEAIWVGVLTSDSLIYLYGANTELSFKNKSQYAIHVGACYLCAIENSIKKNPVKFYDLGGLDGEKGYGKFKQNYKGEMKRFFGPIDIQTSWIYGLYKILNFWKRFFRS